MKTRKNKSFIFIIIAILAAIIVFIYLTKDSFIYKKFRSNINISEQDLDIVYGADSVDLTIYMFSNYNCSFCRKFFIKTYPKLKTNYIDKNKIKLIVKPLALTRNKSAINSLKISVCINKYGNFDNLNTLLLTEPKVIYTKEFNDVVNDLIEKDIFVAECMYGGEAERYINENIIKAHNLKISGTPTFIINNKIYKGNIDYNKFKEIIEKELR